MRRPKKRQPLRGQVLKILESMAPVGTACRHARTLSSIALCLAHITQLQGLGWKGGGRGVHPKKYTCPPKKKLLPVFSFFLFTLITVLTTGSLFVQQDMFSVS